jgi:hypothetical protein
MHLDMMPRTAELLTDSLTEFLTEFTGVDLEELQPKFVTGMAQNRIF